MITKKEQLLNSALELFVTKGFHGASTNNIAKNAWVSNGILFHYFKTKEELIIGLYIKIKEELIAFLESQNQNISNPELRIKEILIWSILWWIENKNKYYFIQQVHFSPYILEIPPFIQETHMQLYIEMVENAKDEKIIKDLPLYLILSILSGQINAICDYLLSKKTYTKQDIEEWVDMVWGIIGK